MISAVSYQFSKFVEFAQERVEAGKESAIARTGEVRIGAGTPLEERAIYSTDKTDFVGMTLLRTKDAKAANDEVRELFRKTVAEMFGGEGNIPDSVKDAMLLKDYGSGKPLTARRILEVNNAILGRFFEVFLFEEVPAQERKADGVYLAEVDGCDIYLGIFGHTYGNVDSRGVSATEREYRRANIASQPQTDKGAQGVGFDVGLNVGLERTVVDEIRARPKIRMSEIAVKYQVTKRTVERVFSKLTQEGKIARVGGKRFGHWEE